MTEKTENWKEEMKKIVKEELKPLLLSSEAGSKTAEAKPTTKTHETLAEQMLCPDCNPPKEYVKAHLKLMGLKRCRECGNIDREKEEWCHDCGQEYKKEQD